MKTRETAQDRRRARRAAERAGISETDFDAIQELALVAAATGEISPPAGDPLPEEVALAKIDEAFQHGTRCACGHSFAEHSGSAGACSHEDGRGTCSCSSFSEATTDESAQADALEATATTTIHVDGLELVKPQVEKALRATLGDVDDADAFVQRFMLHFVDIAPPADGGVETAHGPVAWTAIFVPEATLTDDGRAFAPGALEWRDLPLSLMAMTKTSALGGHDGAEIAGRIDLIWREGNLIMAGGVFDDGEFGAEISRMVADGTLRGLSIDIAIHEAERGPKSDYFDENGGWIVEKPETAEEDEPSIEDLLFGDDSDLILVVTKGVIGMATVCPFPAFAEANISLAASAANPLVWTYQRPLALVALRPLKPTTIVAAAEELAPMPDCANCDHAYADHPDGGACDVEGCDCSEYDGPDAEPDADPDDGASLTAAAAGLAPLKPPVEWFQNPELTELTPLTIDEDGRLYGHAWGWGICHTGVAGTCTTAPHSNTNYAYFHVGEIECEDGEMISVGRITFDTGHADRRLSRQPALSHYDNTGKIGAFVVVGEDEHGGWLAGALAAEISEEEAQRFRGSAPSGDWRAVNGNLELIALLSVNVPGFPGPRPRAMVAAAEDGLRVLSLTAAGVAEVLRERTPDDDFREIGALADVARGDYDELLRDARG